MNSKYIYIYICSPAICMKWLDIEIFPCNMHELARHMHVVPYHVNELHIDIWSLCIKRVNMNMYMFGG